MNEKDVLNNLFMKYDAVLLKLLYPAQYGQLKLAIEEIKEGEKPIVSDPFVRLALYMMLCDLKENETVCNRTKQIFIDMLGREYLY